MKLALIIAAAAGLVIWRGVVPLFISQKEIVTFTPRAVHATGVSSLSAHLSR
jgi:hypothetical protein